MLVRGRRDNAVIGGTTTHRKKSTHENPAARRELLCAKKRFRVVQETKQSIYQPTRQTT